MSESVAARVPGVRAVATAIARLASVRAGRVPLGLVALLPVAILLDLFDAADEIFLGPVGMSLAFLAEAAFVLGVTGRSSWSIGAAALDLVPGVDVIPWATITLASRIAAEWGDAESPAKGPGPVIDV